MIIKFSNLGAIKETELDLRPLTVIIGPNNSNKTYIAYSVYGLWKTLLSTLSSERDYEPTFGFWDAEEIQPFITVDDTTVRCQWDNVQKHLWRKIVVEATNIFRQELANYYQDSSGKIFSLTQFSIFDTMPDVLTAVQKLPPSYSEYLGCRVSVENNEIVARLHPSQPTETGRRSIPLRLNGHTMIRIMDVLFERLFSRPIILPAERNAFILTYKLLQHKRFLLFRDQQIGRFSSKEAMRQLDVRREQGDIRFPEPVEDFLDSLTEIELSGTINNEEGRAFQEIASLIEKEIQGNHRTQFRQTRLGGKELVVKVSKDLTIDLYNASSSIKQLAPLLLYLRYRARENDLLIIDEPEMNLHPESQVKLLEILAMLVNAGVKVLLTTHSPYFLAHLNNLAQDEEKPESVRKRQATSLYLKDPRAFLSMEQVSAYEMKDNELVSLKDPDYGIRWDTLSDVSVDVNRKYFEIYEKGKVNGRARKSKQTAQTEAG